MDSCVAKRILQMQEKAMKDERYLVLVREYQELDKRFLDMSRGLTAEQRNAVMDLLGVVYAMNMRMLEIAFSDME